MEDRISGRLQHHHKTCCEKGGHHGRQACRFWEMISLWECSFQTGGLVYDNIRLIYHKHIVIISILESSMFFSILCNVVAMTVIYVTKL